MKFIICFLVLAFIAPTYSSTNKSNQIPNFKLEIEVLDKFGVPEKTKKRKFRSKKLSRLKKSTDYREFLIGEGKLIRMTASGYDGEMHSPTISGPNASDFQMISSTCYNAPTSCETYIQFTGASEGLKEATYTIYLSPNQMALMSTGITKEENEKFETEPKSFREKIQIRRYGSSIFNG